MTSYLELMDQEIQKGVTEDLHFFLDRSKRASVRMQKLVHDLLTYSRLGTRGTIEELDLNQIIIEIKEDFTRLIQESKAVIQVDSLASILGVKREIKQLFQNILSNAIKFTGTGKNPEIHISMRKEDANYLFLVRDNGIGIKSEFHESIFEMFERLYSKDQYEGTGIGLAQCRKIIEFYEGRIWVDSELGKGSTFFIQIPEYYILGRNGNGFASS